MFTAVYLLATAALVFFEGLAIGRTEPGDTISEHIWTARATWAVLVLAPFWFWMTGHFWNPAEPDGSLWNDMLYLAVGMAVGIVNVVYTRRHQMRR